MFLRLFFFCFNNRYEKLHRELITGITIIDVTSSQQFSQVIIAIIERPKCMSVRE